MTITSWVRKWFAAKGSRITLQSSGPKSMRKRRPARHLELEALEDRTAPAVIQVNSLADNTIAGNNLVTLREAIIAANTDTSTDLGETGSGTDEIQFQTGPGTILLTQAGPIIGTNLTITGLGATQLAINGANQFQVFNILSGPTVIMTGLTIQAGLSTNGGGIFNSGNLSLISSSVSGNKASNRGAGIYNSNYSTLTLTDSVVSENDLTLVGGEGLGAGIFNGFRTTATVRNSLLSNNRSNSSGGGIGNRGTLTIINSTLSGNLATNPGSSGFGGGIFNSASLTLLNSTVTGNSAIQGGGIYNYSDSSAGSADTVLQNTIVAGNTATFPSSNDFRKGVNPGVTSNNNLIGDPNSSGGLVNGTNGNIVGNAGQPWDINVILDPKLSNNGGRTPTHALIAGSPAIDKGSNALLPPDGSDQDGDGNTSEELPFDQRGPGFPRRVLTIVDIGAFEFQNQAPTVNVNNPSVTVFEGQNAANAGTFSDLNPGDIVVITASIGAISQVGTTSGTWAWSLLTNDGPAQNQTVTITATDSTKASSQTQFDLIVNNVAPTPSISAAPATNLEGTTINLTGSATDPSTVDTVAGFTFAWAVSKTRGGVTTANFATGTTSAITFTPDDDGTYDVSLTATDKDNAVSNPAATRSIIVANVAPTPSISVPPANNPEATTINLTGSATDPSTADTAAGFTFAWTVSKTRDGLTTANFATGTTSAISFTPDDDGTYDVSLTATDKDNAVSNPPATRSIIVANVAPTPTLVVPTGDLPPFQNPDGPRVLSATISKNFTLQATDPASPDTAAGFIYQIDWDDGTPLQIVSRTAGNGTGINVAHTFQQRGTFNVVLTAIDKDSGQASTTPTTLIVTNPFGKLANGIFTDEGGNYDSEAANLLQILTALRGPLFDAFFGISGAAITNSLVGKKVLIIPELENGDLVLFENEAISPVSPLDDAARAVINNFVTKGGGLIIIGEGNLNPHRAADFLNAVFGFSVQERLVGQFDSLLNPGQPLAFQGGPGTSFTGNPATLPVNDSTSALSGPGVQAIYTDADDGAAVALLPFGGNGGQIVYLGWDFFNAGPGAVNGGQDGGWTEVLRQALQQLLEPGVSIDFRPSPGTGNPLVNEDLPALIAAAQGRWQQAGLTNQQLALLKQIQFSLADLPGTQLASAQGKLVTIDSAAAGHGWFLDGTPFGDEEFAKKTATRLVAQAGSPVAGKMDLLTVLMREMGQLLGLRASAAKDLLAPKLGPGTRYLPPTSPNYLLSQLRQEYGFHASRGSKQFKVKYGGQWFQDSQGQWFALTPTGLLVKWDGISLASSQQFVIANLGSAVYKNLNILFKAPFLFTAPPINPQILSAPKVAPPVKPLPLTSQQLNQVVVAALERWAATGLSASEIALLNNAVYTVANLGGSKLANTIAGRVTIDGDAAGQGWFIDQTPLADEEYPTVLSATHLVTASGNEASKHLDLLTVVMHEMGHLLGLQHGIQDDLMFGYLGTGERRLPL